jgi:regulator of protease activity HflC (stomatin/prohibitin superfamily)
MVTSKWVTPTFLGKTTMSLFGFIRTNPTTHLMVFQRGQLKRQGPGLSLMYFTPTTSLVAIPLASIEAPFIFEQVTSDFQTVTVQGQLSYRITQPERIAARLNFALTGDGKRYESEDPLKLPARIVALAQVAVTARVQMLTLTEALAAVATLAAEVHDELDQHAELDALGVEIQGVAVMAIRPTPETARALEARTREAILREADEAIYARRQAAVENERTIKESELDTEIAVEEKKRTIRETQMEAEASIQRRQAELRKADMETSIELERRREALVSTQALNTRTTAEAEAHRVGVLVEALRAADPRIVQALAAMGMQPGQLIAQAFGGLAEKAERIGQLNLSPDLLQTLLQGGDGGR